ncbi:uncharacterized protein ACBR49_015637 [Aulostomus maculatus]
MNLWLLLTFFALAQCRHQKKGAHSCPDLCSCSSTPSGEEVMCSDISMTYFPADNLPRGTTRLSIQSTNLSTIVASHLSGVPFLVNLQLYHNRLTSVPSDLLRNVTHLNLLDLTGNQLVYLPPHVFSQPRLSSLVLKNNLIEKADSAWFSNNNSLTWLDLSGNRLSEVPVDLLQKLKHLEDLDLSDNNLTDLQADALKNLQNLKNLNVAGNKISTLKASAFTHNLGLSQLFLQENQIQELPATLIQGLQHLELLLLNHNQLKSLPRGLLDGKNSTFAVILTVNPWMCDDKIEYLWKWLTLHPQNVLFADEVVCDGPPALKGRQVVSLTHSELI